MKTSFYVLAALCGLAVAPPVGAQRLLWESTFIRNPNRTEGAMGLVLTGNQRFLLLGAYSRLTSGSGCQAAFQAYYRTYGLGGTVLRETLGRNLILGNLDYARTGPNAGWVAHNGIECGTVRRGRPFLQRLTPAGDTLPARAWYPVPAGRDAVVMALLAQGNKLVTAGWVAGPNTNGQFRQMSLTCSDTLGRVRWQRAFPRLPFANDNATAVLPTPRGGYLLSGDAYNLPNQGFDHYVLETDSGGQFRRARLIQPLGPGYPNGTRYNNQCNALALPNAGGYLLAGTADSARNGVTYARIGYILRLDTALNVTWVYRHPPALSGTGAAQNFGYRLRLLPNGTVGLLLTEVRGSGTADIFLAQVRVDTGQRVGFYALSSNTQTAVVPTDWQWVGDGTLLVCGGSRVGTAVPQSYVARWDFSRTALAAGTAAEATAQAAFSCYPNPSRGPVAVEWQLGPGHRAGELRLYSGLGQLVRRQALPATASGRAAVVGLAAGLYLARLVEADGTSPGRVLRVEVRE